MWMDRFAEAGLGVFAKRKGWPIVHQIQWQWAISELHCVCSWHEEWQVLRKLVVNPSNIHVNFRPFIWTARRHNDLQLPIRSQKRSTHLLSWHLRQNQIQNGIHRGQTMEIRCQTRIGIERDPSGESHTLSTSSKPTGTANHKKHRLHWQRSHFIACADSAIGIRAKRQTTIAGGCVEQQPYNGGQGENDDVPDRPVSKHGAGHCDENGNCANHQEGGGRSAKENRTTLRASHWDTRRMCSQRRLLGQQSDQHQIRD